MDLGKNTVIQNRVSLAQSYVELTTWFGKASKNPNSIRNLQRFEAR